MATTKNAVLKIEAVTVNSHCDGEEWTLIDFDQLAYLIALIALGQVIHAENILSGLDPAPKALVLQHLKYQATALLSVPKDNTSYSRDGFLFECISWIAGQQSATKFDYAIDPHLKATTQGLDGLMLKVVGGQLKLVTIIEDKCTKNPKGKFGGAVMKTFREYHGNMRSSELLAATGQLLRQTNIHKSQLGAVAGTVLTSAPRRYRASLTVDATISSPEARADVFAGYETLAGLNKNQRLGAVFKVPEKDLRPWCEKLADAAKAKVAGLPDLAALGVKNV